MLSKAAKVAPAILLTLVAACQRQDQENSADAGGQPQAQAPAPATPQSPQAAGSLALTPDTVNSAAFVPTAAGMEGPTPAVLRAQVLLDRTRFSPGVIDGASGENTRQAIAAFEAENGLQVDGQLDEQVFAKLTQLDNRPALTEYELTQQDVSGPFVQSIPEKFEEMSTLKALSYTSAEEAISEKFHVTPELLKALNPNVDFSKAGQRIIVPALGDDQLQGDVKTIIVDKGERAVRVMGADGRLLAFYPATIGSDVLPSPEGVMKVRAVAPEPTYTFDPEKLSWEGAKKKVTVAAGPNNPVGSVWIDLTKDTYGIHGTPEPRFVGKRPSHGCVRLTNWDAEELASRVKAGIEVRFVQGSGTPAGSQPAPQTRA